MKNSLSEILANIIVDKYGNKNREELTERQLGIENQEKVETESDVEKEEWLEGEEGNEYSNNVFGAINCLFDEAQKREENPEEYYERGKELLN